MSERPISPVSLAVVASLAAFAALLAIAVAIGGSYALTLHALHAQAAEEAALKAREATFQIRQAVPTCEAINQMDVASHVPAVDFPAPPANIYDRRLSAAIHAVNVRSHCPAILNGIAHHESYAQILKQLGGGHS